MSEGGCSSCCAIFTWEEVPKTAASMVVVNLVFLFTCCSEQTFLSALCLGVLGYLIAFKVLQGQAVGQGQSPEEMEQAFQEKVIEKGKKAIECGIKALHKDTKNLDKLELAGILFFLLICPVSTYTLIWLALNFEYAKFAVKKFAGVDVVEILSSNKNLVKDKLDIVLANIPRSSSVTKKND